METQVFGERTLYDSRWVRLVLVDVETPDGRRFEHHVVRLARVSIAVVIDQEERVLLMWRHRFVPDAWGWELPGGIVETDEDAAAAAARETEEETGWRPGPMRLLTSFQPMSAWSTLRTSYTSRRARPKSGSRLIRRRRAGSSGCIYPTCLN